MIDKQAVIAALRESTSRLVDSLSAFPAEKFNSRPFTTSWSAGQVADHLLQLEKRINHIIAAPATVTERNPTEKVETIRKAMGDFNRKHQAPSFILPSTALIDQHSVIDELRLQRQKLLDTIEQVDITELCASFPHNRLGELTRLEWVYFTIYHTERHLQQMKAVEADVTGHY